MKVVERIPTALATQEIAHHVDAALLQKLEVRRFGQGKKQPRGKKVPAGESYTRQSENEEEEEESGLSESDLEDEVNSSDMEVDQEPEAELPDLPGPSGSGSKRPAKVLAQNDHQPSAKKKNVGSYVVAIYEQEWFLAEVVQDQTGVQTGYTRLNYMCIKGKNSFSWSEKKDLHITLDEDILLQPVTPEPVTNRGYLGLKKKDFDKVGRLMVVVYLFFNPFFLFFLHTPLKPKKNGKN